MKIGIYDPYLDTLGGGEKYILSIASCLKEKHKVFLFWDDSQILVQAKARFDISLENVNLTKNIFHSGSFFKKIFATLDYDVIFYVSDGSIPTLFSKKNILIFQFPVNWINKKNFLTKLKLNKIQRIVCYSDFVKGYLDKTFPIEATVLPPAVDSTKKDLKKEDVILTVGRFTKAVNTKKQEVLIDAFKKLYDQGLTKWRFIIVGSVLPSDSNYVEELRERSKNYPIKIVDNVPFDNLVDYYNKANIYWHAAGFGEDLVKHPEHAEHFGISTVEAMSAGAVPVVINAGGQKEIVESGKSGYLWDSIEELLKYTQDLINNKNLWSKMSEEAKERSKVFSEDRFCKDLTNLIK